MEIFLGESEGVVESPQARYFTGRRPWQGGIMQRLRCLE